MKLTLLQDPPLPTPPWKGVGKKIERTLRRALYEFDLLKDVETLAVALSGGKDSLTLLHMLHTINGRGFAPFKLVAIHVSGSFSCGASQEKDYLEKLTNQMGIPLIIKESIQGNRPLECYSCSRQRRSLLFSAAKEVGAKHIAFGHHREDNIETLLMNLMHKGEFAGMLPNLFMYDYGITLLRPLILVKEEEIKAFSKQEGFARIVCQCPVGATSNRKKTRGILETLETLYPEARKNLSRAALVYGSDKARRKS